MTVSGPHLGFLRSSELYIYILVFWFLAWVASK